MPHACAAPALAALQSRKTTPLDLDVLDLERSSSKLEHGAKLTLTSRQGALFVGILWHLGAVFKRQGG